MLRVACITLFLCYSLYSRTYYRRQRLQVSRCRSRQSRITKRVIHLSFDCIKLLLHNKNCTNTRHNIYENYLPLAANCRQVGYLMALYHDESIFCHQFSSDGYDESLLISQKKLRLVDLTSNISLHNLYILTVT